MIVEDPDICNRGHFLNDLAMPTGTSINAIQKTVGEAAGFDVSRFILHNRYILSSVLIPYISREISVSKPTGKGMRNNRKLWVDEHLPER